MGTVPECKTTSNAPGHRTAPGAPLGSQGTGLARASPRSYLQPEEVGETLEDTSTQAADAVVGEVPARQAEGPSGLGTPHCPRSTWAGPGRSWGGCASTYRRFSSGRPRKAPGWTVLIRLFFRSLRGDRHRPDLRVCSRGPGTRPLPHPQETQHSRDRDMSAPRSPPSPHLPHTGSSVAPGAAKPHAGALLAAFHPISLLLSLQRVQGRREAPRRSRGGGRPLCTLRARTVEHGRPCAHRRCPPSPPAQLFPEQPYPGRLSPPAHGIRARCNCQHGPKRALWPRGSSFGLLA